MVPGIVLAAGASTRMGKPKALLPCGDNAVTFVASAIAALRDGGVDDVLVVGRPGDDALRLEVETHGGRFVENPKHQEGQLSSLLAGLNVADRPPVRGVLVMPVDMPLVSAATIRSVLQAFKGSAGAIVRTVHRGSHGHPVIFPREVFAQLRQADPTIGARHVVHANEKRLVEVEVGDATVLEDVDTPEEYDRLFGK